MKKDVLNFVWNENQVHVEIARDMFNQLIYEFKTKM